MEQPDAYAGINDTICGLSYQLNANPAVGIGTWTSNTIKSIQDIHQENTIVEVDTFGIHQLIWSDTNQTCFSSDTLEVFFYLGPTATFSVPNQSITTLDLTVPFTNNSIYGENYFWDFDDGINSTEEEPIHTFTSIGFFDILLITYDKYGCSDSSSLSIEVTDDFRVFVPDAFSPNNDQLNDSFKPELIGIRLENYSLIIYDRWGKEVFYTANMDDAWNGKMFNEGKANTQGVYAYKLSFQTFSGDIVTRSGRITLIK